MFFPSSDHNFFIHLCLGSANAIYLYIQRDNKNICLEPGLLRVKRVHIVINYQQISDKMVIEINAVCRVADIMHTDTVHNGNGARHAMRRLLYSRFPFPKRTVKMLPGRERLIYYVSKKFNRRFHDACIGGQKEFEELTGIVEKAKKKGVLAEVYAHRGPHGETYAHFAALSTGENATRIIKLLYETGCNMGKADGRRQVPITAVLRSHGNHKVLATLLRCNPKVDECAASGLLRIMDKNNEECNVTPQELMEGTGIDEVIKLLKE